MLNFLRADTDTGAEELQSFRADIYSGVEEFQYLRYFHAKDHLEALEVVRRDNIDPGFYADVWQGESVGGASFVGTVGDVEVEG